MSYANGHYPLHLFVHRGGNLYFAPSLNARWDEMVRLAAEKYGVRLFITGDIDGLGGWNVYRPIGPQRNYRRHYGNRAAEPGFSSHGGKFRGQEVFALDIANVNALAPGNQSLANARLTALARAVGLTVNFVTPTEWWHVGDFNPAWAAPNFGAVVINPGTTNRPAPVSEEDDMIAGRITDGRGVKHHVIIGNGHLRHLIDADDPEWMKNVCTADDRWTDIPIQRLPSVLRSFACDLHIWDIRNGSFVVLDPLTGIVSAGALWSATNAGRSGIARVEVTSAETAAYIAELAS